MQRILITGTSQGLGLELAKYYLRLGATVVGLSRSESRIDDVSYFHCTADITRDSCIIDLQNFVESLAITRIDILINNAGTGSYGFHLSEVDPKEVLAQVNLHCVGALRIAKSIQKYLNKSMIVNVTSRLGSIRQNERGDFSQREFSYSYRIAKCSQNMLTLCMSNDPELSGNKVISINPGLLKTASGSDDAQFTAIDGAREFVKVLDSANLNGIYHAFGEAACY